MPVQLRRTEGEARRLRPSRIHGVGVQSKARLVGESGRRATVEDKGEGGGGGEGSRAASKRVGCKLAIVTAVVVSWLLLVLVSGGVCGTDVTSTPGTGLPSNRYSRQAYMIVIRTTE